MPALSRAGATRALAVTAVLFAACTAITAAGWLDGLDHSARAAVRRTAARPEDVVLSLLALPASVQISAIWLLVLVAATQLVRRRRRRALVLAAGVAAGCAIELLFKVVLDHPGPTGGSRSILAFGVEQVGRGSYPSGHMLRGTALALGTLMVLLGERRGRAVRLLAAAYVAELAWSRVYLNEHWTSDVIGGLLVGIAAALAVRAIPPLRRARG